jgi:hypothetical protein
MVLPLFFGLVYALPRAVEDGHRGWMGASAALVAANIYAYLFHWVALAAALALWAAWLLVRGESDMLRRLLMVGGLGVLLALPEAIVLGWIAVTDPGDVRAHTGLAGYGLSDFTVSPVVQRLVIALPFAWALLTGPERNRFYIALWLAPLPLALVEGVIPQPWHFTTRVWTIFSIPFFVSGTVELLRRVRPGPSLRNAAAVVVASFALAGVAAIAAFQIRAANALDDAYAMRPDEHAAFEWIDSNTSQADVVVSTSITTNLLLASLTPSSQYVAMCCYTTATDEELIDRYLRAMAAFGFDEETTFERLQPGRAFPFADAELTTAQFERDLERYVGYHLMNWEVLDGANTIDARVDAEWRPQFRALQQAQNPLQAANDVSERGYRATFIYCGTRERFDEPRSVPSGIAVRDAFREGDAVVLRITTQDDPAGRAFEGCERAVN